MTSRGQFYSSIVWLCDRILRRYFREIAVTGIEHVPEDGGGVLVSWHPNGMIDPGLILTYFPRTVIFGARDGLFRVPLLGWLMRRMGAVPIYRQMDADGGDPDARRARNSESLRALADAVVDGGFACLFPEGNSHDSPHPLALKTGAARFLRQAWHATAEGNPHPVLLPIGLHYQRKQSWRSRVLIAFHPPMPLPPPPEPDAAPEELKAWDSHVTAMIKASLHEVVHATEDWSVHHLLHHIRLLARAERAHRAGSRLSDSSMAERTLGFSRAWAAYHACLSSHTEQLEAFRERMDRYITGLLRLGLHDHELDHAPSLFRRGLVAFLIMKTLLLFVILPPFILLGLVTHAVPGAVLWAVSRGFARRKKDVSSIKVLLGAILFPLTWAGIFLLAYHADQTLQRSYPSLPDQPVLAATMVLLLSIGGLAFTVRYVELAQDTIRSARVRLIRAQRRAEPLQHARVAHRLRDMNDGFETCLVPPAPPTSEEKTLAN